MTLHKKGVSLVNLNVELFLEFIFSLYIRMCTSPGILDTSSFVLCENPLPRSFCSFNKFKLNEISVSVKHSQGHLN